MAIFFTGMATFVYVVTHNPDLEKDEYKVSIWYVNLAVSTLYALYVIHKSAPLRFGRNFFIGE
jgi:hypothetical protein